MRVVRVHRHSGGLRKTVAPDGSLNHFYGAFLLGFLWSIISICVVLSLFVVYLRILSCPLTSQPKWIPVGSLEGSLSITPLWISKELSSQEGPFDFKNEKYGISFLFYLGRAHPASSLNCPIDLLEFLPTRNELHLLTSCLQFNQLSLFILSWLFKFLRWLCMPSNACFSSECYITAFFCFLDIFVQQCVWVGLHRYVTKFVFSYFAITLYEPVNLFLVLSCGARYFLRALV